MIEALGLTMRFGPRTVVERLSFQVGRGELCAFLGRNGAGKTTTMRLLAGVLRPVSGGACINGHDVTTERRAAAASIGFLPEAPAGFSRLTIGELLRFCGESRGLFGRALSEAVDRVIERVHAREARDVLMGRALERLAPAGLARAGAPARPSGADPRRAHRRPRSNRAAPRSGRLLEEVSRDKAILLATHVLEEAEEIATRVILIARGRIVADDVPAGLADERGRLAPAFHRLAGGDSEDGHDRR